MRKLSAVVVAVAALTVAVSGCGGEAGVTAPAKPSFREAISKYIEQTVQNCAKTGDVQAGLPIYNCGFPDGSQGCFTFDANTRLVAQYTGGMRCPTEEDSVQPASVVREENTNLSGNEAVQLGEALCLDTKGMITHLGRKTPANLAKAFAEYEIPDQGSYIQRKFAEGCRVALRKLYGDAKLVPPA